MEEQQQHQPRGFENEERIKHKKAMKERISTKIQKAREWNY